ncbi:C4-dicarboxylate ABC transporter permease [Pseudomonas daroniae]|uniref:TRAP transporter small permease protein n=1 Tax=Phytopseudomonas daroniae TaxID=2487519 RepID=A0A4Q9QPH8_9GAMM|nr:MULTISPECIES: TRAP transporter small permease subunit [Pseudomonas]TBU75538.1 C4-dicarboxylate ABC transporter permease [Pseudomonas daroniae]TBU81508.1 C4-dicarboxylate ABC transporter permease [Pseudomonas daroniae]TBU84328.1 C4-dicarboxylate ABC transporter permease [Pseudomonas sp. FRB 228]TBU89879.1 C4-dicarboxylate ABC transporter permease [Pseudomonas daroniae]
MMYFVTRIEGLVEALGAIARACVLLLVLLVSFDVLMRYLFDLSPVALQELEWYLISPIALLGIAYTLKHRQDVRVDFLYEKFGVKTKAAVDLFSGIATAAIGFYIARLAFNYTMQSYNMGEGSPDPGGLPYRFLIKAFLPLGFALFGLQGVADSLRALCTLLQPASPREVRA